MFCSNLSLVGHVLKVFSIGLIISKASNAAELPCDYYDSIDITNGLHFPNNSVFYDGMEFLPEHYAKITYKVENGIPVRRNAVTHGCPCMIRPCIRFCCPYGSFTNFGGSSNQSTISNCIQHDRSKDFKIKLQFHNGTINEDVHATQMQQHFGFVNKNCDKYHSVDTDLFYEV